MLRVPHSVSCSLLFHLFLIVLLFLSTKDTSAISPSQESGRIIMVDLVSASEAPRTQGENEKTHTEKQPQKKNRVSTKKQSAARPSSPAPSPEGEERTLHNTLQRSPSSSVRGAGKGEGVATLRSTYTAQLIAWLNAHKHYPARARRARMEGEALLFFRIDAKGVILEHTIRKSTGHYVLDDAITHMITTASPVPPPPEEVKRAGLEFVIPVMFRVK